MRVSLPSLLAPPTSGDYEQDQKAKIVHVSSLAIFVGALVFAAQNIYIYPDTPSAIALFGLAGIALIALYLNHRRRFQLAAVSLATGSLAVLDYAIYEGGASLYDTGIVVYPIFILAVTFYFGRRGLVLSTLLSVVSVALLYYLQVISISKTIYPSTPSRFVGLSILFVIAALIISVIRETWENHLKGLQESYDLTLGGWARALEYRDGETEGHSRRVTALCVELARRLGCSAEEILNVRRGALLHDIGKMAIPDRILFKVGPLNDQEWEIMRQHPTLAAKMISEIPFLQSTITLVKCHHEYWDGSGYPEGLKGEAIPLGARIFAIVDHWDALSSDRPYRKAWARENVLNHLRENSGKLYDPRIATIFLEMIADYEE